MPEVYALVQWISRKLSILLGHPQPVGKSILGRVRVGQLSPCSQVLLLLGVCPKMAQSRAYGLHSTTGSQLFLFRSLLT